MKHKTLAAVRLLEAQIKCAPPEEAGKLTKKLVRLKDRLSDE